MPKKILFESAVHHFLAAGSRLATELSTVAPADARRLAEWTSALSLDYPGSRFQVSWHSPVPGECIVTTDGAKFYTRGDQASPGRPPEMAEGAPGGTDDPVELQNRETFDEQFRRVLELSGLFESSQLARWLAEVRDTASSRKRAEELFHDEWAATVDVQAIPVRQMNEACTAPEMRYIRSQLGDLRGVRLLDVGCGLGEASVYFAMEGADVTASDISPGMLDTTRRLAEANQVTVRTALSAAEDLGLDGIEPFDVIYTGNTLHHVDIETTLDRLLPHLKPDGLFVSWDPVAYNPVINVYRRMATAVRTEDEHPLRLAEIRRIRSRFGSSHIRWFWLTTLAIFILMAVVQRRSPNKERYWKKVIEEADQWAWLYRPLAWLDRVLLTVFPFLGPLCWNVVIIARGPKPRRAPSAPPPRLCSICQAPRDAVNDGYLVCPQCCHRDAAGLAVDGVVDNGHLDRSSADRSDGLTRSQLALTSAVAPGRGALLDLGSGTGKFLNHARSVFSSVAGVEVSPASLRFATVDLGLQVVPRVADLAGPFDVVTSWHALEHIPGAELPQVVRDVRERCGPNSVFLVCVPNPDCRLARWLGSAWAFRDRSAHCHEFSRRSLDRLLAQGGFEPVREERVFAYTLFACIQSLANLGPFPHNYIYYRLKRGTDFGWSRVTTLAVDLAAALWLLPAALLGGLWAAVERLSGAPTSVHTVLYRPVSR